jgi:predicted NUDIX family NTP pyrophosphohydrolase
VVFNGDTCTPEVTFDFWDLEFEIFEENNPDWGSEVFEFCSVPCVDWLVLKREEKKLKLSDCELEVGVWDLEFEIFEENNPDWGSEVFEFCSVPCVDWLVLKREEKKLKLSDCELEVGVWD